MKKFLIRVENWVFQGDSMFLDLGKLTLVVVAPFLAIFAPLLWWDASRPNFTLVKAEWACVQSHTETILMPVGRVIAPVSRTVCTNYKRIQ